MIVWCVDLSALSTLTNGCLLQGTLKVIPLVASEIAESNVDSKAYAFRLRARNARRTYYMYAENGHELHDWMQAICFAKAAGNTRDSSQTCTLQ